MCAWFSHKGIVCRNAAFGDPTKNHTYNYTSAISTSVIPKICLSHFQSGMCETKPTSKGKHSGLGVW